ncbi:MAG: helix-turn-helix transcriptional regulator [Chloroflexi bacterium]|nr:helix-turn-helix transcriptional regulator [Chloroflexota bacterium]
MQALPVTHSFSKINLKAISAQHALTGAHRGAAFAIDPNPDGYTYCRRECFSRSRESAWVRSTKLARYCADHALPPEPGELHVLRMLAHDTDSIAIAQALVLSETTVRTHMKTICGKLDGHNRAAAITKAHEAGLPLQEA